MGDGRLLAGTFPGQLLLAVVFLLAAAQSWAQAAGAPDFKLVPKLQELKDRPPAPDFTLPDAGGRKVSLKDFRGKIVFLNFWATWCESCREEMPSMERLYREFKGGGLVIVAVNIKEKPQHALAFAKELKLSYPVLLDPEGEVGQLYGAFGLPATYVIDRKGVALARMWGPADWHSPAARKLFAALLARQ